MRQQSRHDKRAQPRQLSTVPASTRAFGTWVSASFSNALIALTAFQLTLMAPSFFS